MQMPIPQGEVLYGRIRRAPTARQLPSACVLMTVTQLVVGVFLVLAAAAKKQHIPGQFQAFLSLLIRKAVLFVLKTALTCWLHYKRCGFVDRVY